MFAFAAVGAVAGHVVAYRTAAGVGKADRSVDEDLCFYFAGYVLLDVFYLVNPQFSCKVYPFCAELPVGHDRLVAGGVCLCDQATRSR